MDGHQVTENRQLISQKSESICDVKSCVLVKMRSVIKVKIVLNFVAASIRFTV